MSKLLLIDGNAIFHRAFHALPLMNDSQGNYTNAIYGFTKMLFEILIKEKPDYLAIAFDHKDKTFRHKEFVEYKANRSAPPPELYPQLPTLLHLLETFNIPLFQISGFEADDIIGTLSALAEQTADLQTLILTGDKDSFQLVTDKTQVITPLIGMSKTATYDPTAVKEKMGVRPDQIIDYKALRGDASDNIPGVKGIGEKQAVELLQKYNNLDNIYQHLDQLTAGQRTKLTENKETAYLSQRMATIIRDMPIKLDLEACKLHSWPVEKSREEIGKLGFKTLESSLNKLALLFDSREQAEHQPALF